MSQLTRERRGMSGGRFERKKKIQESKLDTLLLRQCTGKHCMHTSQAIDLYVVSKGHVQSLCKVLARTVIEDT